MDKKYYLNNYFSYYMFFILFCMIMFCDLCLGEPNIGNTMVLRCTRKQYILSAPASIQPLILKYGSLHNVPKEEYPSQILLEPTSRAEPKSYKMSIVERKLTRKYGEYKNIPEKEIKAMEHNLYHHVINKHKGKPYNLHDF